MNKTPKLITNKELMAEWLFERNNDLSLFPEQLSTGSGYLAWWKCQKCGQEWQAQINSRNRGVGCPYCAGKKPIIGVNDFQTKFPDIAKEWHPTFNGNVTPSDVTCGSGKKYWWICSRNHEYQSCPRDRSRGLGCPKCAAALKTSFPEQAIYYYIKKCFPDAISRYKDIFTNRMELDIYIPSIRTGIEYDGLAYHNFKSLAKDNLKYNICREHNIQLIRIYETSQSAIFRLYDRKIEVPNGKRKYLNSIISQLCYKLGHIVDVNIERDKLDILGYLSTMDKTFASEYPDVAEEWDYEANYPLRPENFSPFSNERVSWICKYCGKKWVTSINTRTANNSQGCRTCALRNSREKQKQDKLQNNGSLYDLFPELMEEWNYEINAINPKEVLPWSNEKASWKCKKCGFEWETEIRYRTKGHGCLRCSHQAVEPGLDDLATLYPEIAEEWDYEKNDMSPTEVAPKSNKIVSWKCSKCGHNWDAMINSRVSKKAGCPCCSGRVPKEGMNDLATLYPELASEWNYEANLKDPTKYVTGSHYVASWKCSNCGHIWEKEIRRRIKHPECPVCHINILSAESQLSVFGLWIK